MGVARSSIIMASGTIASRILGFVRTVVLALTIGVTTDAADAVVLTTSAFTPQDFLLKQLFLAGTVRRTDSLYTKKARFGHLPKMFL